MTVRGPKRYIISPHILHYIQLHYNSHCIYNTYMLEDSSTHTHMYTQVRNEVSGVWTNLLERVGFPLTPPPPEYSQCAVSLRQPVGEDHPYYFCTEIIKIFLFTVVSFSKASICSTCVLDLLLHLALLQASKTRPTALITDNNTGTTDVI